MYRASLQTAIGFLNIEVTDWSVMAVYFTHQPYPEPVNHPLLNETVMQLTSYFDGKRTGFNLPIDPPGTVFQRTVWNELMKIPYGKTLSYTQLALRCGDVKKLRAVAAANAANPIAVIIPCHRVLGSMGQLTGYAWGLDRKEWLLNHEQYKNQISLF